MIVAMMSASVAATKGPPVFQAVYDSDGDDNGVFYRLGTLSGSMAWSNPVNVGTIAFEQITGWYLGNAQPEKISDRVSSIAHSASGTNPGVIVDLDPLERGIRLAMTDYSYRARSDDTQTIPSDMWLEGSNDGISFTPLDNRSISVSIDAWTHEVLASKTAAYRYFKFYTTSQSYFTIGELELYGSLYEVRPTHFDEVMTYVSDGDNNGVFYFLGTLAGLTTWRNPHGQLLTVSRSSNVVNTPSSITDRTASYSTTNNGGGEWIKIDLGANRSVVVSDYSLQDGSSVGGQYPRAWKLQGSNDDSAWTDLDIKSGDTTINSHFAWGHFTCSEGVPTAFRYIRFILTGVNSDGDNYNQVGEIELYGEFIGDV